EMKNTLVMKWILFAIVLGFSLQTNAFVRKDKLEVTSPDKRITIKVTATDKLYYSVTYKGKELVKPSAIALKLSDRVLGDSPKVTKSTARKQRGVIELPYGNTRSLDEEYNEIEITCAGGYDVVLRAYNEGVAYRFKTSLQSQITVVDEEGNFNLTGDPSVICPESENYTSWEVPYKQYASIDAIGEGKKALTPVLFSNEEARVVIAESDVLDYPGMYLKKVSGSMKGTWAPYPKRTELGSWGNFVSVVKETEDYIARTEGTRTFPWRIIIPTDDDRTLIENRIVFKLAKPLAIDASWVKPGKAAWEWWHDAIVEDADIPSGMNNRNTDL